MNAQQMINELSWAEVDSKLAPDARRVLRDQRFQLTDALRTKRGIGDAMAEAKRVAKMWGVTLTALVALCVPSVAMAADDPKPSVCADFRVYQADGGKTLGVCYDGKKPALFSTWLFVDMVNPAGATRRYAIGFR